jgi:hypothetical protein
MKISFKNFGSKILALTFAFIGLISSNLNAQICGATNSYGCSIDWFSGVEIKNSKGDVASFTGLTCSNTGATNKLMTTTPCIDFTPGETIEIKITNGCTYSEWAGVWLDLNGDNKLDATECLSGSSGPIGRVAPNGGTSTGSIKLPCNSTFSGTAILRIRCLYISVNANQGCGTVSDYGNIMDFQVNIKKVTPPVADFTVPKGNKYTKAPITFVANGGGNWNYKWTYSGAGKVGNNNTYKGVKSWDSAGTYNVRLDVDYCGIKDSIEKPTIIIKPTAKPVADFISDINEVELSFSCQLFDLSNNGAWDYKWSIISPTGADDQTITGNPQPVVYLGETGWYNVCLESYNDIGWSDSLCKKKYIECTPAAVYYHGPSKEAANKKGILYDHNGPTGDYANGRKQSIDYIKIIPCGAKEIRFSFLDLNLADNSDIIKFYDGDQADPAKLIAAVNAGNQAFYDTSIITCTSGVAYITFESGTSGTGRGYIISWESDLNPPSLPKPSWTSEYKKYGVGVNVEFKNTTSNVSGLPNYVWSSSDGGYSTSNDFTYAFTTDGTYKVCLTAQTCTGIDSFCSTVDIETPTTAWQVDYKASNLRPSIGELITLQTKTDYANVFEWSIFPTTFTYENGTSKSSQNPQVKFTAGGPYTFTLSAYNAAAGKSASEKKVIKNKYVVVIDYCTPLVDMLSSDVAINSVVVKDKNNRTVINNASTGGVAFYTDYSDPKYPAKMTFGSKYDIYVDRKTNSNQVNYKAWIDWNIDGDFTDAGEEIMSSGATSGNSVNASFSVPKLKNSFEGKTKMRVGVAYGSFANSPCGVNQVGEFEDYLIELANDNTKPMISLVGSDTIRVEKSSSVSSCYSEIASKTYSASDATEGDLTSEVVLTSDLDCTVPGVYAINFALEDASGNKADSKTRFVIVVLDRTAPVLTLNGNASMQIDQCASFIDPGAIAMDNIDGNLTTTILTTGSVDSKKVGDYKIVYSVKDAQGNTANLTRTVLVRDTTKPGIYLLGKKIVNNSTIDVQIKSPFVDDIYAYDDCNGNLFISKNAGFNGPVNNQVRATYPVVYNAVDPSGNKAVEDGFVINYRVDDFIAPNIELNTEDTVYHDVLTPYSSRSVSTSDNYYLNSQISISRKGNVDPFSLGVYTEVFTATDGSGNSTSKTRYVKVIDQIAPQIVANSVNVCVGVPFWAMSGLILKDNYYGTSDLLNRVNVVSSNVNIWESGSYFIAYEVTDPSGNTSTTVIRDVYVSYPPNCTNTFTGVENFNLNDAVSVYPNPTSNKVKIGYALNNNKPVNIEVSNALGAVVARLNNVNSGFGTTEINLGDFGRGMYMIRFTNDGQSITKKVIVQE